MTHEERLASYPILKFFEYVHLAPRLAEVSAPICELAHAMAEIDGGAETSAGLRKLMEAKDCFVRAALIAGTLR